MAIISVKRDTEVLVLTPEGERSAQVTQVFSDENWVEVWIRGKGLEESYLDDYRPWDLTPNPDYV